MKPPAKRKIVFNISTDFKALKILGEGAYGVVCLAVHLPTGTKVAIKKLDPFSHVLLCKRTLREIHLLKKFRSHENVVKLLDVQIPPSFDQFNEIYLIQEYMPADLYSTIAKHRLGDDHVKFFTYQILRGLKYIHSAGVIHRDLKPSNILVNENCDLKICDLGLSRPFNEGDSGGVSGLTEYVATRWYRAPEIMLTNSNYSTLVDLWSVGCILAELFIGTPLFPGKDYRHQIMLILKLLGTPTEDDVDQLKNKKTKKYLDSLPFYPSLDISTVLHFHSSRRRKYGNDPINPLGLDLVAGLLQFNPTRRINVLEALEHPYLDLYHDPTDEPVSSPLESSEFPLDESKEDLGLHQLKVELYNTVLNFRK